MFQRLKLTTFLRYTHIPAQRFISRISITIKYKLRFGHFLGVKKELDTPPYFDLWLDWEVMTSADGLEMVDLIGNNTNIKDCNFAEGERERERKKNTLCSSNTSYIE